MHVGSGGVEGFGTSANLPTGRWCHGSRCAVLCCPRTPIPSPATTSRRACRS